MAKYICKRILRIIPVLLVVAVISFFVTHLMPGDPVKLLLGDHASKEQILSMRRQLNLDKPLLTQFGIWFVNMLHGDLGESLFGNQPVIQMIKTRMEPTVLLAIYGQLVGMVIGISLGIIAAFNHGKWADKISIAISLAGISAPSFWVAIMLIEIFAVKLGWLPVCGYKTIAEVGLLGTLKYLVLPGTTIAFMQCGQIARMTRSAMLDILNKEYLRTARAKGVPEKIVIMKHALKNAMLPIITVSGFSLAVLLGGTWIVETIFNIPGTGNMAINAIMRRDYPLIQGSLLFVATIYLLVNLLVDILYGVFDSKVRSQYVGIVIVLTAIFIAVFCPIITKYDPLLVNVKERITAPTGQHKLGTDEMGRDVLSRMFFGVRASMIIGVSVAIISTVAGIIVGVIAGYYKKVDNALMRILDGVMAFPSIIIAIALAGILGTGKINIIIALSVAYFPTMARIVRSSVLSLRDIEYVQSIKVLGASDAYIIIHHIIPNIISPIIVQMTFIFALAVFDEAALSYLGVGIRAPEPSLGGMVSDARKYMSVAPWTILYPGLMIAYIVLGLNLLGDGLRDYFDPKLNEK